MRDELIEYLRAAAYDDAVFAALPERLAEAFDLTSLLMGWIGSDGNYRMMLTHNFFDQDSLADYFLRWADKDLWLAATMEAGVVSGQVKRVSDLVPTQLHLASPFYRDFLRPRGFDILYAVSIEATSALGMGALAMHRGPDKGDFTDEEMEALRQIAPEVEQLQKVRARMAEVSLAEKGYAMVIDRLQTAALVLGEGGYLLEANRKGARYLESGELLRRNGALVSARHTVARWFDSAIAQATRADDPTASSARFEEASGVGVVMTILPLSGAGFERRAMLAISFPQVLTEAHEPALAEAFELTRGEASVVRQLANGLNVEAIANARGTSLQTVRVQVRNAMMKTHCSRQAQLVDLVRQFVSVADGDTQFVV